MLLKTQKKAIRGKVTKQGAGDIRDTVMIQILWFNFVVVVIEE